MWATRIVLLFVLLYILRCVHEYMRGVGLGEALTSHAAEDFYDFHRTERSYSHSFEKKNPDDVYRLFPLHFFTTNEPLRLFLRLNYFFI